MFLLSLKQQADMDKMGIALSKLAEEDPTFRVRTDESSGQTIISGMGELHLEVLIDRMKREFKVEANQGRPQVAYKEAITASAQHREVYKKQTGVKVSLLISSLKSARLTRILLAYSLTTR